MHIHGVISVLLKYKVKMSKPLVSTPKPINGNKAKQTYSFYTQHGVLAQGFGKGRADKRGEFSKVVLGFRYRYGYDF